MSKKISPLSLSKLDTSSILLGLVILFFLGTTVLFWIGEQDSVGKAAELLAENNRLSQERSADAEEAQKIITGLRTEHSAALARIEEIEREALKTSREYAATLMAYERTREELSAERQLEVEHKTQLGETVEQLEFARAEVDRFKTETTEFEKKLVEARALVEALNIELAALRNDTGANTLLAKIAALETEVKELKATGVEEMREKIKVAEAGITGVKEQLKKSEENAENLEKEAAQLREANAKLEAENKRYKTPVRRVGGGLGVSVHANL